MKNGNLRKYTALCFAFIITMTLITLLAASNAIHLNKEVIDAFGISLGVTIGMIAFIIKEHAKPKIKEMQQIKIKPLPNKPKKNDYSS